MIPTGPGGGRSADLYCIDWLKIFDHRLCLGKVNIYIYKQIVYQSYRVSNNLLPFQSRAPKSSSSSHISP